jgi:hypothetical protein
VTAKMFEANRRTTHELFTKDPAAFIVPPHQREYAWTTDQVEQLLADLYEDGDSLQNSSDQPYFLGSLLFASEGDTYQILDGQQRIVTVSLLISALKFRLSALGDTMTPGKLENLIRAGRVTQEGFPKIELQPVDQEIYKDLLTKGKDATVLTRPKSKKMALVRAWEAIWSHVARQGDDQNRLRQMVDRLLYDTSFVQIETAGTSEAFVLFETLNDRGLALNSADLVKNRLLSMVSAPKVAQLRDKWVSALGQLKPEEALPFLRHYYLAHYGFARKERLYDEIRKVLDKAKSSGNAEAEAISFVSHLKAQATLYRFIVNPGEVDAPWKRPVRRLLRRLKMFNVSGFRPLVLLCQERDPERLVGVLKVIESTTVRFSVIGGKNPNKLEKAYSSIATKIRDKGADDAEAIAVKVLGELTPPDDEFKSAFCNLLTDNVTNPIRAILAGLHEARSPGETEPREPDELHVDHIFPSQPSEAAYNESGITKEKAESLTGLLGNLTFLPAKPNISISNGPFSAKRVEYANVESLPLTKDLSTLVTWNEESIRKRTEEMFSLALRAWPSVRV